MAVKVARTAAPKVAAMATRAKAPGEMFAPGNRAVGPLPIRLPNPPLMSSSGASVPPEVPDPRASHQATSLARTSTARAPTAIRPGEHVADGVVADAERPGDERGRSAAKPTAPITGCQNGGTGSRS